MHEFDISDLKLFREINIIKKYSKKSINFFIKNTKLYFKKLIYFTCM